MGKSMMRMSCMQKAVKAEASIVWKPLFIQYSLMS